LAANAGAGVADFDTEGTEPLREGRHCCRGSGLLSAAINGSGRYWPPQTYELHGGRLDSFVVVGICQLKSRQAQARSFISIAQARILSVSKEVFGLVIGQVIGLTATLIR
jgi:hypothetical protein